MSLCNNLPRNTHNTVCINIGPKCLALCLNLSFSSGLDQPSGLAREYTATRRRCLLTFKYFLLSDVNAPWDFYRAQIRVFEYAVMSTRVQITSAYFAAIITESGKICACAGTSSGRYWPRVGNQRYLQVLPSTFFDS